MAGTSKGLGAVATMTTHESHPHHQCVVSKMASPRGSADNMYCAGKDMVVEVYQYINISLRWMRSVCLNGLGVFLSLKMIWWILSTTKWKMASHVRWWR